jgi:tetratricopeptide (TPR) repeat protein
LPDAVVPLTALRREKVGELAYQTVANRWFGSDKAPDSIEAAVTNPYGLAADPQAAADAYRWLTIASQWSPKVAAAPEFGRWAVLAAANSGAADLPPDLRIGPQAMQVVSLNGLDYPHIAVRYAHAKVLEAKPGEEQTAMRLHVALARDLLTPLLSKKQDQTAAYEQVFGHGIEFGRGLYQAKQSPELADLLAELCAAKGQFLWDRRFESWDFDPFEQMATAYDEAIKLLESQPESRRADIPTHIFHWGRALLSSPTSANLQQPELNQIIDRARHAIAVHQQTGGAGPFVLASGIVGQAMRQLSNLAPNLNQRAVMLTEALKELELATSGPSQQDNADTAYNLMNFVQANIDLAHILSFNVERHAAHLGKAVAAAERAVACDTEYPEVALRSLGNACEDSAWFIGFVRPEAASSYQRAIEAFTSAEAESLSGKSLDRCARGRCYYKRYRYGPRADKADLDKAISDLKAAADDLESPSAEASFWLFQIALQQKDMAAAEAHLERARELASPLNAPIYMHSWALLPILKASTPAEIPGAAAVSRERARMLAAQQRPAGAFEDPRLFAAHIEARAFELEGKLAEAVGVYSRVLDSIPAQQLDYGAQELIQERCKLRVQLRSENWRNLARADALKLLELQPTPWQRATALGYAADIALQAGQRDEAKRLYREFVQVAPVRGDGSFFETVYPAPLARFGLARLLRDDLNAPALTAQQKQQALAEAKTRCDEILNSNAVLDPRTSRAVGDLRRVLEDYGRRLVPATQPPATPPAARRS